MVLEADIFVLPSYLLGFPLNLTYLRKFSVPVVRYWRGSGIHLVLYLDDGAGCEKDFPTTQHCSYIVRSDLVKTGLVPHCDKSFWTPVQRLVRLGISWNLLSAICPSLNLALIDYYLLLVISRITCLLSLPFRCLCCW